MIVYHGTSLTRWKKIKRDGLIPRGATGHSNWGHSIDSNPEMIYFTDAYAMHFCLNSIQQFKGKIDKGVIIEIDTDLLDQSLLMPDEDAIEQIGRHTIDDLPKEWNMIQRTKHYRDNIREYAAKGLDFKWSMSALGTAAYRGIVPPEAFTRSAVINVKAAAELSFTYMDCQISVLNYKFCQEKYKLLSKMIFGLKAPTIFPENSMLSLTGLPTVGPGITVFNLKKRR